MKQKCHSNYWKVREEIKDLYITEKRFSDFTKCISSLEKETNHFKGKAI